MKAGVKLNHRTIGAIERDIRRWEGILSFLNCDGDPLRTIADIQRVISAYRAILDEARGIPRRELSPEAVQAIRRCPEWLQVHAKTQLKRARPT